MKNSKKFIPIFLISVFVVVFLVVGIVVVIVNNNINKYHNEVLDLPIIRINTENNMAITSKEEYLKCQVTLSNSEDIYEFKNLDAKIRGRGNHSWQYFDKKPYKLKFEEKIDLFGNGKAKTWTLIANAVDGSMIRNYLAYNVGSILDDLSYTTSTQYVDLYVNGNYRGVYLVCEQVETGKNRVDIDESMESVDTGYLIELDAHIVNEGVENVDYFVCEGKNFGIKTPDVEDELFNSEYLNFIKSYVQACFDAMKGDSFESIEGLMDVNSFVDSYILNELFKSCDIDFSSFYMYKDAGGKLCSGPIWDYDFSSGNSYVSEFNDAKNIKADNNIIYGYLLQFDEFKSLVSQKIETYYVEIENCLNQKINYVLEHYSKSFERNYTKWGIVTNFLDIDDWKENVSYLKNWLLDSLNYMKEFYCD